MGGIKEFMKGVGEGARSFGELVSGFINTILLAAVFFLVAGPTALVARVTSKSFLPIKRSSWVVRRGDRRSFYRQF